MFIWLSNPSPLSLCFSEEDIATSLFLHADKLVVLISLIASSYSYSGIAVHPVDSGGVGLFSYPSCQSEFEQTALYHNDCKVLPSLIPPDLPSAAIRSVVKFHPQVLMSVDVLIG
jgi:hypothetical protein